MRTIAIVDVDTTLANNDHRAKNLQRICVSCSQPMMGSHFHEVLPKCSCGSSEYVIPQNVWDEFLSPEQMLKDTPQPHALDVLENMRKHCWWIVFMTGRNEKYRSITESWLDEHMKRRPMAEKVLMRSQAMAGLPASVTKEQMFLQWRRSNNLTNCSFVFFEDDRFVLGMWKNYGVVHLCPDAWVSMNPVVHDRELEPSFNR